MGRTATTGETREERPPNVGIDFEPAACQAEAAMWTRAIAVIATFLLVTPATARVRLVCNGASYPCPRGAAYKTISSAIRSAGPGDWVLVWSSVYHEKGSDQA